MAISTYSVTWRLDVKNILDNLADIAGLTPNDGVFIVGDGANWVAESGDTALTSLGGGATGIALFKNTTAAAARTELGLGTIATQAASNVTITGGSATGITVDNSVIGGSTPAAGSFTSLTATTGNLGNISGLTLASGDIIYANATPALTNLAKGSDGQVLTLASGLPSWADGAVSNWVQTHFATATSYGPGTDVELLGLATTINNVAASNAVEVMISLSVECSHNAVFYVERNATEIGSAAAAGSRVVGLFPMPFDNDTDSTMSNVNFSFIDESPDTGTNAYTVHVRLAASGTVYVNRTVTDSNTTSYERVTSCVILKELAQ